MLTTLVASGATTAVAAGSSYGSLGLNTALSSVGGSLINGLHGDHGLLLAILIVACTTKISSQSSSVPSLGWVGLIGAQGRKARLIEG